MDGVRTTHDGPPTDYAAGDNADNGKIYAVTVDIGKAATAYYEPPENTEARLMANP